MRMTNGELQLFCNFLDSLELIAKDSRMRTRFIKIASERLVEIETERMNIARKYAVLNDNGDPVISEKDGKQTIDIKDMNSFKKDFSELLSEEFVLDETEERKDMFLSIKKSILNTDLKFKGEEAVLYDKWCEIVENISY